MTGPLRLSDPAQVDLDRHAVIEASAGTGKTYTIERLVLRLIVEKGIPIDRILLVTYTEKAAGELRQRVRSALVAALAEGSLPAAPLEKALSAFGEAQVFTIHGFCGRVLQAHAFENGQPFRLDLVEDRMLPVRLLREEMRSHWPRVFGDSLEEILRLSDFPGSGMQEVPWESKVLGILERHRPACADILLPEPPEDMGAWLKDLQGEIALLQGTLRSELGLESGQPEQESAIWAAYQDLPLRKDVRSRRAERVLLPLLRWLNAGENGPAGLLRLVETCNDLDSFKKEGFSILLKPTSKKAGIEPAALLPALLRAAQALDELSRKVHSSRRTLATYTVKRLHEAQRSYKEQRGLMGYEDMLVRLDEALDPGKNPQAGRLLSILRERYLWALVDEFQDTDQVQWRIFRRIFTGGGRRLALIGDPKQAIYGFRGADLEAYLEAREEMQGSRQAVRYLLPRNWRSRCELVECFNELFAKPGWFGVEGRLRYEPIDPPPPEKAVKVHRDDTGRAPLTVIELPGVSRVGLVRARLAAFIALEIERLLGLDRAAGPRLVLGREGRVFPLEAGHIGVLVRNRIEAAGIEKALAAHSIPFSHYKKTGLWSSLEAIHFHVLLAALARPGDPAALGEALLTPFFRVPGEDGRHHPIPMPRLRSFLEAGPESPAATLFSRWCELAASRRWSSLFRSMLEETGLLLDLAGQTGGERLISDYQHISQLLQQEAYGRGLDTVDLVERIAELRLRGLDDDMHRLETEEPRVQIMTIHGAKGLEFPVLFLAGGFTSGPHPECWKFHDGNGRLVRDLAFSKEFKAAHTAEEQDEERRLYYVALTRAMVRLYIPLAPEKSQRPGPLSTLVRPALLAALTRLEKGGLAGRVCYEGLGHLAPPGGPPLRPDPLPEEAAPPAPPAAILLQDPLPPEQTLDTFGRKLQVDSFSGLSSHSHPSREGVEDLRSDDEPQASEAPDGLPPGPHTGEMIHGLLERIPFEEAASATCPGDLDDPIRFPATRALLDELLPKAYPELPLGGPDLLAAYRRQALDLAWPALHIALPGLGIPLCHIPRPARLAELEFLYPLPFKGPDSDRFLTGIVDLLVLRNGKVWLIDWKSNYLPQGYGTKQIADAMAVGNYELQLDIYALALQRWLAGSGLECGGFFFLFLRGLDLELPGQGIYYRPAEELAPLEPELLRRAGRGE